MFRRRGFRRRRGRRPTQWIASAACYGTGTAFTAAAGVQSLELCGATGQAAEFDPPVIQRFKIETIRGNIQCWQSSAGTAGSVVIISMGIAVVNIEASLLALTLQDPSIQKDAGLNWMWLRHWQIIESATVPNMTFTFESKLPFGSDVNTRTKRIVRQNQVCMLFMRVSSTQTTTGGYTILPYLRTLISKVA